MTENEFEHFTDLVDDGTVNGVRRQKHEHPHYKRWSLFFRDNLAVPEYMRKPLIHQWQYIYRTKKGRISLVELGHPYDDDELFGGYNWEICGSCTPDGDVERYPSKEEAEKRICELLLKSPRWCFYNELAT